LLRKLLRMRSVFFFTSAFAGTTGKSDSMTQLAQASRVTI
jgi:hypothetical protein